METGDPTGRRDTREKPARTRLAMTTCSAALNPKGELYLPPVRRQEEVKVGRVRMIIPIHHGTRTKKMPSPGKI